MSSTEAIAEDTRHSTPIKKHSRHFKSRLIVCTTMLALAFISLILMDAHKLSYFFYCQIISVTYATLCIWLQWYINRLNKNLYITTLWHQLLHWCGLFIVLYLVSVFVSTGLVSSLQGGIMTFSLLALTTFLAGVYTEPCFIVVGFTMMIFAGFAATTQNYISLLMLPVLLISTALIFAIIYFQLKKQ